MAKTRTKTKLTKEEKLKEKANGLQSYCIFIMILGKYSNPLI